MIRIVTKFAITAALIVLVSEVAKRSDKAGALIAALPLVTLLALGAFALVLRRFGIDLL